MSILVVGSVALDAIKTPLGKCREVLGGSAVYFSTSASFFNPVSLIAVVGEDFPKRHVALLEKKKIDTRGLEFKKGKTFRWEGEYGWSFSDAQTIATHLNVFADFDPKIPEEYRRIKNVFLANIDPVLQRKVLHKMKSPRLVACDTMNYWIKTKRKDLLKLLKEVDLFFLNEGEARQLTGEVNIVKAAKAIERLGPKKIIIKKGEHGSLLFSSASIFSTPAYLMEAVFDPTGAGDTFAGGVMGFLAKCKKLTKDNLRKSIVYGTVMATFAVEAFSLRRLGSIKEKDIKKRYKEYKKLTVF